MIMQDVTTGENWVKDIQNFFVIFFTITDAFTFLSN